MCISRNKEKRVINWTAFAKKRVGQIFMLSEDEKIEYFVYSPEAFMR